MILMTQNLFGRSQICGTRCNLSAKINKIARAECNGSLTVLFGFVGQDLADKTQHSQKKKKMSKIEYKFICKFTARGVE